jgi:TonB family protein
MRFNTDNEQTELNPIFNDEEKRKKKKLLWSLASAFLVILLSVWIYLETRPNQKRNESELNNHFVTAVRYEGRGDLDNALLQYRKCIELTPDNEGIISKKIKDLELRIAAKEHQGTIANETEEKSEGRDEDLGFTLDENTKTTEGKTISKPIFADGKNVRPPDCYLKINPDYPELALKARIEGKVVLKVVWDTEGRVIDAIVVSSPGKAFGFDDAALEAVKKWRCHPAIMNGKPMAVYGTITINFSFQGTDKEKE